MADKVITTDGGSSGAMTVLAVVLFTIVLLAILYFTGVFGRVFGDRDTNIDVNINKPGIVLHLVS